MITAIAFIVGACIGSFIGCALYRLPRGISLLRPPSACPACGHRLTWAENIPIISYIRQRGRARCCGAPLSHSYLWAEIGGGLLGAAIATLLTA